MKKMLISSYDIYIHTARSVAVEGAVLNDVSIDIFPVEMIRLKDD